MRETYRMPGEFEPHQGTLLIWPVRPGSWPHDGAGAKRAFCQVMSAILDSEAVFLLADPLHYREACQMAPSGVQVLPVDSDDAWARDVGPTFVTGDSGTVLGIDWAFNAWGGAVDGLYPHYRKDDLVAGQVCRMLGFPCQDAHPFVLEGGSIHADGQGTLLTTAECLLSPGRNPDLSQAEIEATLCRLLGVQKVIWLPRGIYHDETNGHVDNICAFTSPGEVVLAWTEDKNDPQYPLSRACLDVLSRETDARGRRLTIHRLPIPARPITVLPEDLEGYRFEAGEARREVGERLAASYVNFYVTNTGVLVPQFGDPNDQVAVTMLGDLFPGRRIWPIPARDILLGGGNIHCITQQIPKGGTRLWEK